MERSYQVKNWKVTYTPEKNHAFFENQLTGCEGILTLNGKTITDYDGVYELPLSVIRAARAIGLHFDKDVVPMGIR